MQVCRTLSFTPLFALGEPGAECESKGLRVALAYLSSNQQPHSLDGEIKEKARGNLFSHLQRVPCSSTAGLPSAASQETLPNFISREEAKKSSRGSSRSRSGCSHGWRRVSSRRVDEERGERQRDERIDRDFLVRFIAVLVGKAPHLASLVSSRDSLVLARPALWRTIAVHWSAGLVFRTRPRRLCRELQLCPLALRKRHSREITICLSSHLSRSRRPLKPANSRLQKPTNANNVASRARLFYFIASSETPPTSVKERDALRHDAGAVQDEVKRMQDDWEGGSLRIEEIEEPHSQPEHLTPMSDTYTMPRQARHATVSNLLPVATSSKATPKIPFKWLCRLSF